MDGLEEESISDPWCRYSGDGGRGMESRAAGHVLYGYLPRMTRVCAKRVRKLGLSLSNDWGSQLILILGCLFVSYSVARAAN